LKLALDIQRTFHVQGRFAEILSREVAKVAKVIVGGNPFASLASSRDILNWFEARNRSFGLGTTNARPVVFAGSIFTFKIWLNSSRQKGKAEITSKT